MLQGRDQFDITSMRGGDGVGVQCLGPGAGASARGLVQCGPMHQG